MRVEHPLPKKEIKGETVTVCKGFGCRFYHDGLGAPKRAWGEPAYCGAILNNGLDWIDEKTSCDFYRPKEVK